MRTLLRKASSPKRSLAHLSDEQLLGLFSQRFNGYSPKQVKTEDPYAYITAAKRGLIPIMREKGIIVRQLKHNPYNDLTDDQLMQIAQERYQGQSPHDIEKDKDNKGIIFYATLHRKGLIKPLVSNGVLVRKKGENNYATRLSDEEIIGFAREHYTGQPVSAFKKGNKSIYDEARKRNLVRTMVDKDILVNQRQRFVASDEDFLRFLDNNSVARDLVAASALLNGQGGDLEQVAVALYGDRFRSTAHLHGLIEKNLGQIYEIIQNGITSLGPYIGGMELEQRPIIPIVLDKILEKFPPSPDSSLEDLAYGIIKEGYGAEFNRDPEKVMGQLETKANRAEGLLQRVYQRLNTHYGAVMKLERVLA